MTEYTGVHVFSIPQKYHTEFLMFYAQKFNTTSQTYSMYSAYKEERKIGDERTIVVCFETVDNEKILKEIEKLKNSLRSLHWYQQLNSKRLYQIFLSASSVGKVLKFNVAIPEKDKEKYKYKYLYYVANASSRIEDINIEFSYFNFLKELDEYIPPEEFKDDEAFENSLYANCCVCIKTAFDEERYDRVVSSKVHSIYFKNEIS